MRTIQHFLIGEDGEEVASFDNWFMSDASVVPTKDHPSEEFLQALGELTREDRAKWVGGTTGYHYPGSYLETRFYTVFKDRKVCFAWNSANSSQNRYNPPDLIRIDDCILYDWSDKCREAPSHEDIEDSIYRRRGQLEDALYYKRRRTLESL